MKSFATLAFVGAVAAQANYAQPKGYEPSPPTYDAPPSYDEPEHYTTTSKVVVPPTYGQTTTKTAPVYPTTTSKPSPPVYGTTSTESIPSYPTSTCPAPGSYDSQGRYSCNPAHAYPTGQTCKLIDGCYYLEYPKTSSVPSYPTKSETHPAPYPTPSCPAPGDYDNKGRYSCNPAHAYPTGQTCKLIDGCYYLEYPKTSSVPSYPTKSETHPAPYPTPSCPAPGDYDNKGRYSCNPAHAYPTGQTCKLIDGCYYLEYPKTTSSPPKYPTQPPVYTTEVVTTDYTTYCPQPTTFTHGPSTYTVTSATTITLPCKGGCTVTKPVYPHPTTVYKNTTVPVYPHPTTVTETQPPKYTTKVETQLTTYCPEPTTITVSKSTYTVTSATTLTIPCEHGCTVTKEIPQPPKTYVTTVSKPQQPTTVTHPAPPAETHPAPPAETHPAPPAETHPAPPAETHPAPPAETHPAPPAETHPAPPAETHPAPPAETHPVAPPKSPEQPQQPPVYPTAPKPSTPVVAPSATTSRPPIATYTGAAAQKVASGMVAVAAAAAFFL
ncbi:uncharacterized protein RHO25_012030 [Cercospora beticola]|uniref:Uncharacterized protein n=1 Tax=Cercospora beticola TaxID=122368 RepID=A0ABZ0P777_CERBT|nr:hypothetical protein RHO25_012030 [Cercospora beticola]